MLEGIKPITIIIDNEETGAAQNHNDGIWICF